MENPINPPARLRELGDYGYSYTNPASLYRVTEPTWRRPRAGSQQRRGPATIVQPGRALHKKIYSIDDTGPSPVELVRHTRGAVDRPSARYTTHGHTAASNPSAEAGSSNTDLPKQMITGDYVREPSSPSSSGVSSEIVDNVPLQHRRSSPSVDRRHDYSSYHRYRSVTSLDDSELENELASLPASRETRWEQVYVDGDTKLVQRDSSQTSASSPYHASPPQPLSGGSQSGRELMSKRGNRKVVLGLPRPLTFKRMNSGRREKLLEVPDELEPQRATPEPVQENSVHSFRVPDDRYRYFVSVYINGTLVKAFPDNCSELNLVSEAFVANVKLEDPPKTPIRLPNGTFIKASGSVTTHCKFTEDGETFKVKFVVLPRCLHPVILCDSFLRRTETELVVGSRIQYEPLESAAPIQVCLNGTPRQQVIGSINGEEVIASPDIGSDVNVITEVYAQALGLVVAPDPDNSELFLVDGSFIPTCGILRDIEWRFGKPSTTARRVEKAKGSEVSSVAIADWKFGKDTSRGDAFICDFYVVKKLTVSIILSSTLLYGTNAFTACPQHFKQSDALRRSATLQVNHSDVAVLHRRSKLHAGAKDACEAMGKRVMGNRTVIVHQSRTASVDQKAHEEEAVRRGLEEIRIARLAPNNRPSANHQESLRRAKWDRTHSYPTVSVDSQVGPRPIRGSSTNQVLATSSVSPLPPSAPASSSPSTNQSATSTSSAPTNTTPATTPVPPSFTTNQISASPVLPLDIAVLPAQLQGTSIPTSAATQDPQQSASSIPAKIPLRRKCRILHLRRRACSEE